MWWFAESTGLARNLDLFPRLGASKLLHSHFGRQPQGVSCSHSLLILRTLYFHAISNSNCSILWQAIIKPQYVDHIPKAVKGNVGEVLAQKDEREMRFELAKDLDLNQVLDRDVGDLSGGELQRFAIAVVATQHAEIYMFDEPSSYLDVKQRLKAAQVVRSLLRPNR